MNVEALRGIVTNLDFGATAYTSYNAAATGWTDITATTNHLSERIIKLEEANENLRADMDKLYAKLEELIPERKSDETK